MQLGLGTWIDSPAPAGGGADTITPTAVYYYDGTHFGVAFDEAISLTGTPSYTCNGSPVVSAGSNPTVDGVTCTISGSVTGSGTVGIPADDPAVTSQGGGLFVTAGTYTLEAPPALTYSVDPEATGTPQTGETLSCNTGSVTGYGYPHAQFAYQWELSANGSTAWAAIDGATADTYVPVNSYAGQYLRCAVQASVGGGPYVIGYSNVVGPIAGVWEWSSPGTDTFTAPVAGDYQISAIGGGASGQSGATSAGGYGGGGGAFAGGLYAIAGAINVRCPGAGQNAWVNTGTTSSSGVIVKAQGSQSQTGGAAVASTGQVVWDGGNGSNAVSTVNGGGGGSSAGPSSAGNSATDNIAGAEAVTGGGAGGNGGSGDPPGIPGLPGGSPGGGGGGGYAGQAGGSGGNGWVRITGPQ